MGNFITLRAQKIKWQLVLSEEADRIGGRGLFAIQIGRERLWIRLFDGFRLARRKAAGDEEAVDLFAHGPTDVGGDAVADGAADAADATADAAKDAGNAVEGTVNAAGDAAAAAGDKIQEETKKAEANDK